MEMLMNDVFVSTFIVWPVHSPPPPVPAGII